MRRVTLRIVPFLMVCYFISFLDRVNLGFAALQMVDDLHFSATVFGFGAGIFFVSYFLFEVPSNLLLEKFGARRWIARIMITWGVLAGAMALVTGARSLYLVRFLLGAAEAGFFPGVILYLTYWFPSEYRARIVGLFMVAIPVSSFLGSPISAALLGTDGWLGLRGCGCSYSKLRRPSCSASRAWPCSATGRRTRTGSPPTNAAGYWRHSRRKPASGARWDS